MGISQALWVSMRFRRFVGISRHLWGMMGLYGQELVGFTRASGGKCGGGDIKGTSGCPLMLIGLCQYQEGVEKPIWKKKKKKKPIGAGGVCHHLWGLGLGQGFPGSVWAGSLWWVFEFPH